MKRLRSGRISLSVMMVATLVLPVILTAGAVGIPAIWLIRSQLDQQAWALVEQGSRSTQALLSADQANLVNLAQLTAQRPTLARLLQEGDRENLTTYLQSLRKGADLDLILICGAEEIEVIQDGRPISADACRQSVLNRFYQESSGGAGLAEPAVWMLASQQIPDAENGETVAVGVLIDEDFAENLRARSGLEQILLFDGKLTSASFKDLVSDRESFTSFPSGEDQRDHFSIQDIPYFAIHSQIENSSLELISSLSVENINKTQQTLTRSLVAGILIIVLVGTLFGGFLASRINQPLLRLRDSATALRSGDLTTPIMPRTRVAQIAQVSYALEDARIALNHSLKALRQEKEWSDHLLNSVLEGILVLDRQSRITFFSQGAEQITGYRQEQVVGKLVDAIFQSPGDEPFSQRIQTLGGKQAVVNVLFDGRQTALALTAARLIRSEIGRPGTVLVFRDVSDEEAMRRLLGDFLANITHEFRTPLSALAASIELLLDQLPSLSLDELRELLDSLHLGILGLQTLVDNLLEGASIEAGRFRVYPQPVQINEIIQEAARTMQPLFDKYRLRLVLETEPNLPDVQADPRRTGQALINLMSNAIKWSPPEAEILVSASACRDGVQVSVTDQGPGVTHEQKPELFNRFVHLRSGSQRAEYGAGIGLSVVKAIVETQGGRVGVSDPPDGGSVFWFTVPEAVPDPQLEEQSE